MSGKVRVGLIGSGIGPSKSPALHEGEAAALGLDLEYRLFDLDVLGVGVEALPRLLAETERQGYAGVNITHPCKQAVIAHLDAIGAEAEAIGAVNTVVFRDGRRQGHNTDAWGFGEAFRLGLPGAPLDKVVQLGAGGAGAATAYAVLELGAGRLTLIDAEPDRARALAERLGSRFGEARVSASDDARTALRTASGLIHATPTGMAGHPGLPLPAELVRPGLWLAEVVYFPLETELLALARRRGARVMDGGGMAVFQAVRAFELFTGLTPDAQRMLRHFRTVLARDRRAP